MAKKRHSTSRSCNISKYPHPEIKKNFGKKKKSPEMSHDTPDVSAVGKPTLQNEGKNVAFFNGLLADASCVCFYMYTGLE